MKYVKFIGKFRDLIPAGWTFQKLFARNYRQYGKSCYSDGRPSSDFRIWQHLGGYIEYKDFGDHSWLIFDWITSGAYLDTAWPKTFGSGFYYRGAINKLTGVLVPYDHKVHDAAWVEMLSNLSEEEKNIEAERRANTFDKVIINDAEVNFVLDLQAKGWFEIAEDKRKRA